MISPCLTLHSPISCRYARWRPYLHEIVCHAPREKNMSGISAIHHSLRDVNARTRDVRLVVQVGDFIYRAAVNSHADVKLWLFLELLADFQRAQNWRFRTVAKNERATIASR